MPDCFSKSEVTDFMNFMKLPDGTSVVSDDMMEYLMAYGFFTAPASTKYHGNYEGGLLNHSRMVTEYLLALTQANHLIWRKARSPFIVGMFHDLCKIDQYRHPVTGHIEEFNGGCTPIYDEQAWEYNPDTLLTTIEAAGRTCYKSEDKITDGSAEKFVRGIIKRGHEAVIEHGSLAVRFICDRGVSHEIVRHRLAAFCQESTRYCNYGKEGFGGEITVIRPSTFAKTDSTYHIWKRSCEHAEVAYFDLLNEGCTPQEARSILPNSLKTEVVMTADLREWRHFCRMRCPVAAHPDMRVVANMLLTLLKQTYPVFFEDIEV